MGDIGRPLWGQPPRELLARLDYLVLQEREIAAERLALVAQLMVLGQPVAEGHKYPGSWLRDRLQITGNAGRQMAELAKALDGMPVLAKALAKGEVSEQQAAVIADAVTQIPASAGAEVQTAAEHTLLAEGAIFAPEVLARLGRRILAHVAPEIAEEQERKQLADEEKRASRERSFTCSAASGGRFRAHGWLTAEAGAMLNAILDPLSNPARTNGYRGSAAAAGPHGDVAFDRAAAANSGAADGSGDAAGGYSGAAVDCGAGGGLGLLADHRTPAQRRHDALHEACSLLLASSDLPERGGEKAQVVVTLAFDALTAAAGAATLDTGVALSAEAARRMCCDAGIIPAVLGGAGQVLDLGRERRLVNAALRRALVLRDRGCSFPGCHKPPKWCDAHHIDHWADGGATCLGNCVLLCGQHHVFVHHNDWIVRIAADGLPEFIPPEFLDPDRRPRRNQYHQRL